MADSRDNQKNDDAPDDRKDVDVKRSDADEKKNGGGGGGRGGSGGGGGPRTPNFLSRGALMWILLFALLVVLLILVSQSQTGARKLDSLDEFLAYAKAGQFQKPVVLSDAKVEGLLKDDAPGAKKDGARVYVELNPELKQLVYLELKEAKQPINPEHGDSLFWPIIITWTPFFILFGLVYFLLFRSLRSAGGGPGGMLGSFGRSRHKQLNKEHPSVTLEDVAGIEEAKDEVREIIEFLKNPKKFQRLGGRVPRGVLLIGTPGCGKTLLAKAVAGEADVPFFSISGSDFVEMFVGVGASRVRDLFKQAKDSSPCIIFLDEIDAVGRRRGSGFSSGGHDEREQTLNAILVEMDGFDSSDQVIIVAATNRADVLDPALTRPGRFDRQIHVSLPDIKGRLEILKVHSRKIKMSPEVTLEKLARGTPMFSGADLAAIINEAAIGATMQGKDFVEQDDLEEARDKVRWGRARKSHKIEEDERKVIAYHEAGHAIVMYYDDDGDPLHKVTIIPRGQGLGVTFMLPERDRHIYQRKHLLAQLRMTFGGRIAEELFIGDISSGAAMDIRQATHIARTMVTEYGMSEELGFQLYGHDSSQNPWEQPERSFSDDTAQKVDAEVKRVIDTTYAEAHDLIQSKRDELERLAQALLKYETLNKEEVDRLMRGEDLGKATVADLLRQEKERAKDRDREPERGVTIRPDDTNLDGDAPTGPLPHPA